MNYVPAPACALFSSGRYKQFKIIENIQFLSNKNKQELQFHCAKEGKKIERSEEHTSSV